MQMLTSTDTIVEGGKELVLPLPEPDAPYSYYRDVAVLAFPFQEELGDDSNRLRPALTTNIPNQDANDYFLKTKRLPSIPEQKPGQSALKTLDFGQDVREEKLQPVRPMCRRRLPIRLSGQAIGCCLI